MAYAIEMRPLGHARELLVILVLVWAEGDDDDV